MRTFRRAILVFLTTLTAALVFAASALAAANITLTFVRHAESQANADGIIDTGVPGPHLTDLGRRQAGDVAAALAAGGNIDGLFASDMYRTQETAAPLAALLGDMPVTILPGLHEIDAGIYEGSSEDSGVGRLGYALTPALWTLGARFVPMLGSTDITGNVFQARVTGAVQAIYDSGAQNPVAFSHGATIMFWTMMNVDNPDIGLLLTHQLPNTGVVVLEGNPEDGWTLVNWDGVAVDRNPSFLTKTFVNVRDLVLAPQQAAFAVRQAIAGGDLGEVARAFVQGVVRVALAPVRFVAAIAGDVVDLVRPPEATAAPEPADERVSSTVGRSAAAAESEPAASTESPAPAVGNTAAAATEIRRSADSAVDTVAAPMVSNSHPDPVVDAAEVHAREADAAEAGAAEVGQVADSPAATDAAEAAEAAEATKAAEAAEAAEAEGPDAPRDELSGKRTAPTTDADTPGANTSTATAPAPKAPNAPAAQQDSADRDAA